MLADRAKEEKKDRLNALNRGRQMREEIRPGNQKSKSKICSHFCHDAVERKGR